MNKAKKSPLLIFGAGKIAHAISYYFTRDSEYEIKAYIVDDSFESDSHFLGKPIVRLSEALNKYNPEVYSVFVAVGYQGMNALRSSKYNYIKALGYSFVSYQSPFVLGEFNLGENTILMDGAVIQPYASFGSNVFVWGGAMIGHHTHIQDHCWLTGGCIIGGSVELGSSSFVGMGAILGQEVKTGSECMFGAGTLTTRSLGNNAVVVAEQTEIHRLNSQQFTRMSSCFRI
jgi:sugar O-acyltransferase (sialic acid O-acetyltransferase NeuD family)